MRPVALLLAAILCPACSGDHTTAPAPVSSSPTQPSPGPTDPNLIKISLCCLGPQVAIDTPRQFQALATYLDGSIKDITGAVESWKSSNPSIASVSSTGVLTGHAAGDFRITATYAGVDGTWNGYVWQDGVSTDPNLVKIWLCCGNAQVAINTQRQIQVWATYAVGPTKEITRTVTSWTSSNPSIATVSSTGIVTGHAEGDFRITATYAGLGATWDMYVWQEPFRPPEANEVTGHVRSMTVLGPAGVFRAEVEVVGGTSRGRIVETISDGFFRLGGLDAAGFDLVVHRRGYADARVPVTALGREISVELALAPGVVNDVLEGDMCLPPRTISRSFIPREPGFLRIIGATMSTDNELYGDGVLVAPYVWENQDVELRAGVNYELRARGFCGDFSQIAAGRISFLRPRD